MLLDCLSDHWPLGSICPPPPKIQFSPNPEVLGHCWSFGSHLTLVHVSPLGSADVFWDPLIPPLRELLPPRFSGPWLLLDPQDWLFFSFYSWDLPSPWTRLALTDPPRDHLMIPGDPVSILVGGLAVDHRALGVCFLPSMEESISRAQILWDLLALICIGIYLLIPNPGGTCGAQAPWGSTPPSLTLLDPL